tara:strand:+ start:1638 stop:3047 length:1410 start_codon:yes stop_codon:yes gene_type:complete
LDNKLSLKNHFHFIGIGGIGMSAIAMALLKKGYSISGSDLVINNEINQLKKSGALIFNSQNESNIEHLNSKLEDKVINFVVSSAIKPENKELHYCLKKKLPIKHRSEILAVLMKSYTSLAIAGSHGKTSTSTFLSTLLELCTHDSSSITGGIIPIYNSNAYIDDTKFLVTEIDESDGTINKYECDIGIINNIDFDHCDHFSNINEVLSSFLEFASNSKKLLINYDCEITRENFNSQSQWSNKEKENVTYSIIPSVLNKEYTVGKYYENGNFIDTINIPIPGLHNLSNVTAAIAVSRLIGVDFKKIKKNIKYLKLPKKRFEFRGELDKRFIYDDYAHHPNEIKATIELARLFVNNKNNNQELKQERLVVIFQPHRFSRVKEFINEFAEELSKADVIYITDIFSAGEINKYEVNSETITKLIFKKNKNVKFLKDYYQIKNNFHKLTSEKDLILNMGAGDCHNFWSILNDKN